MEGKTCLITGSSDGIGYVAARELARMGATVVAAGRNATKTATAVARIIGETGNRTVRYLLADLSSQGDVRRLADQVKEQMPRLDVLVNNSGALFISHRRSADGIEMTFALNHLGYYLLTTLLLGLLKDSTPARIVNVSSSSHFSAGNFRLEDLPNLGINGGYRAYGRSKLCNILFTYELARRLEGSGVTVNALHPGLVRTDIARNNGLLGRVVNFFIGAPGYRNGYGKPRRLTLSSGTIQVRRPRVRNVEERFESRVLPLFARKSKKVADLIPELYLHGLAEGDFDLALRGLLGDEAPVSASTVARLKEKWYAELADWRQRPLDDLEVVYMWVDGV